ncbi:GyrI-like domain-containing protein [Aestuariimicrobium soli]|uniref:GyrI-like domain-containing protein n=1 Tax=Aestuariimicrobium soli TaxID=2035834 RepID=UPI003EBCDF67
MTSSRVDVVTCEPTATMVVRADLTWAEFREQWPVMLGEVWDHLKQHPQTRPGRSVMVYRAPTAGSGAEVGVEIGVEVAGQAPEVGRIVASQLPGGRAAHVIHEDGPATIDAAYRALDAWGPEAGAGEAGAGERFASESWEVYGQPGADGSYPIDVFRLLA